MHGSVAREVAETFGGRPTRPADDAQAGVAVREARHLAVFGVLAMGMGLLGAVAAWALYHLIMICTGLAFYGRLTVDAPLYPPIAQVGPWTVIVPVLGGLAVGLMAHYGTDRIRGHGIPEAMEAVLRHKGRVSPKVALFKPISAAIAVGTGGPFGAEGPIIQTGGALGSLIGQALHLTSAERRTLLACGGAAGMVGIFNTPIAAVALALELLLFEFRARSLVPVIIAAGVAAGVRPVLLGGNVMFAVAHVPALGGPLDLAWIVPLGLLIGALAALMSGALYRVEEFFDNLPVHPILKPALGAAVLGVVALWQPRVLGMGYATIDATLAGNFATGVLLGLALAKAVVVLATLGSGTSGGLLAPMLLIGAAAGVGYGRGVLALVPGAGISPALCGIVAMSALFSASARAPLTSFVFAFELTGDYRALAPLMVGCMAADIIARALSRESVMTARLAQRGVLVAQAFTPDPYSLTPVAEVLEPIPVTIPATETVADALARLDSAPTPEAAPPWVLLVTAEDGGLVGVITRGELRRAGDDAALRAMPIGGLARRDVVVTTPGDAVSVAAEAMLARDLSLLPVVAHDDPRRLVGVVTRKSLLRARALRGADETLRERTLRFPLARRTSRPVAALHPVSVEADDADADDMDYGELTDAERASFDPTERV